LFSKIENKASLGLHLRQQKIGEKKEIDEYRALHLKAENFVK
jgi:hypothetical protein